MGQKGKWEAAHQENDKLGDVTISDTDKTVRAACTVQLFVRRRSESWLQQLIAQLDSILYGLASRDQSDADWSSLINGVLAVEGGASGSTSWIDLLSGLSDEYRRTSGHSLLASMPEHLKRHLGSDELTFASLMSGVGGRTAAYHRDHEAWRGAAVEMDRQFAAVHESNDGDTPIHVHKMTTTSPLPTGFDYDTVTHVSVGPPCQPYSRAGKGLGTEDSRDGIPAALAAILQLRPLVAEIEMVDNITKFPEVTGRIDTALEQRGYWVQHYQLLASHYGVPQARRRHFVVASLLGPLDAPAPTTAELPPTVGDVIGRGTQFDAYHTYTPRLFLTPDQAMRCERLDIMAGCKHLRELHADKPARTLTASNLGNCHATMMRLRMADGATLQRPSVEQAAALQTFPPEYSFPSSIIPERRAFHGIGNAVPTELGRHLTAAARAHVEHARQAYRQLQACCAPTEGACRSEEPAQHDQQGIDLPGGKRDPPSDPVEVAKLMLVSGDQVYCWHRADRTGERAVRQTHHGVDHSIAYTMFREAAEELDLVAARASKLRGTELEIRLNDALFEWPSGHAVGTVAPPKGPPHQIHVWVVSLDGVSWELRQTAQGRSEGTHAMMRPIALVMADMYRDGREQYAQIVGAALRTHQLYAQGRWCEGSCCDRRENYEERVCRVLKCEQRFGPKNECGEPVMVNTRFGPRERGNSVHYPAILQLPHTFFQLPKLAMGRPSELVESRREWEAILSAWLKRAPPEKDVRQSQSGMSEDAGSTSHLGSHPSSAVAAAAPAHAESTQQNSESNTLDVSDPNVRSSSGCVEEAGEHRAGLGEAVLQISRCSGTKLSSGKSGGVDARDAPGARTEQECREYSIPLRSRGSEHWSAPISEELEGSAEAREGKSVHSELLTGSSLDGGLDLQFGPSDGFWYWPMLCGDAPSSREAGPRPNRDSVGPIDDIRGGVGVSSFDRRSGAQDECKEASDGEAASGATCDDDLRHCAADARGKEEGAAGLCDREARRRRTRDIWNGVGVSSFNRRSGAQDECEEASDGGVASGATCDDDLRHCAADARSKEEGAPGLCEREARRCAQQDEGEAGVDLPAESTESSEKATPVSSAVFAAIMSTYALSSPQLDYGPGSDVTARHAKFLRKRWLERKLERNLKPAHGMPRPGTPRPARSARHDLSRTVGLVEQGDGKGGTQGGPVRFAPGVAPTRRLENSSILAVGDIGYRTAEESVHRVPGSLYDTGAFINLVDKASAAKHATRWHTPEVELFNGPGGVTSASIGKVDMTVSVLDADTGEWHQFESVFNVLDCDRELLLLGIPFLKEHRAEVRVAEETVTLKHGKRRITSRGITTRDKLVESYERADAAAAEANARAVNMLEDTPSHPYVSTVEEYRIPAGASLGARVQLPHMLAGEQVQLVPLPDSQTKLYAVKKQLRLKGTHLATVRAADDCTEKVILHNFSDKDVIVPAYTHVGQYIVGMELAPHADMTVDEIISKVKVDADLSEEERTVIREKLTEKLFADRELRRSYFSLNRIGRGVGAPPATFEETEEFKRSGKPPPSQAPRPVSGEQREAQREYQDNLIKQGQLVPSSSPFGAAVVMVRKPSGGWRMAFDYRDTNDILVKQHYSLKSVQSCVDALAKSKFFTAIDMISAFWQTPVAPECRKYTAVNFENGKYEYTTMPMGMQAASAIFQRAMDILLTGLQPDVAISFIDDILIHGGDTVVEHLERVVLVIDRVGGAGYTFRPDKCYMAMRSVEFLGSRIGGGTIRPDDGKTAQIREAEFPLLPDDLQKWLGLIQWVSRHVPNAAEKLGPLLDRKSRGDATPPTAEERRCFEQLKAWLTDERGPILWLPDFERTFYLLCDAASTVGMGVALVQLDDDGRERVVAYYSRRWSGSEARWHSLEHECCAMYNGIQRFTNYLSQHFVVITDAEPLVWLRNIRNPKGKYATWTMELQCYDYEVVHRAGKDHRLVDPLSRLALILPEHRPIRMVQSLCDEAGPTEGAHRPKVGAEAAGEDAATAVAAISRERQGSTVGLSEGLSAEVTGGRNPDGVGRARPSTEVLRDTPRGGSTKMPKPLEDDPSWRSPSPAFEAHSANPALCTDLGSPPPSYTGVSTVQAKQDRDRAPSEDDVGQRESLANSSAETLLGHGGTHGTSPGKAASREDTFPMEETITSTRDGGGERWSDVQRQEEENVVHNSADQLSPCGGGERVSGEGGGILARDGGEGIEPSEASGEATAASGAACQQREKGSVEHNPANRLLSGDGGERVSGGGDGRCAGHRGELAEPSGGSDEAMGVSAATCGKPSEMGQITEYGQKSVFVSHSTEHARDPTGAPGIVHNKDSGEFGAPSTPSGGTRAAECSKTLISALKPLSEVSPSGAPDSVLTPGVASEHMRSECKAAECEEEPGGDGGTHGSSPQDGSFESIFSAQNGWHAPPVDGGTAAPQGSGAVYSTSTFRRKRVTAVVFTADALLVHELDGVLTLPAVLKESKREPLRDAAARALLPFVGDLGSAQQLMSGKPYCLPDKGARHMLAPTTAEDAKLAATRAVRWLDLSGSSSSVVQLPWGDESDARMARRVQLLLEDMRSGEPRKEHHLALQAAVSASWIELMGASARTATAATATEASTHTTLVAAAINYEVEAELSAKAARAVERFEEQDDRLAPPSALVTMEECGQAMQAINECVQNAKRAGEQPVMAVDFEFYGRLKHRLPKLYYGQLAIGSHIFVFNLQAAPYLLSCNLVAGAPSLRHWLQAPEVLKVSQHCASDTRILAEHGIELGPVFDTAIADGILCCRSAFRNLATLVEEYVGSDLIVLKGDMAGRHDVWTRSPLPLFAHVYAWQDVAWSELLYRAQRSMLEQRGLMEMQEELSRSMAARDAVMAPPTIPRLGVVIRAGTLFLLKQEPAKVKCRCSVDGGKVRLELGLRSPALSLPAASFTPPIDTTTADSKKWNEIGGVLRYEAMMAITGGSSDPGAVALTRQLSLLVSKRRVVRQSHYVDATLKRLENVSMETLESLGLVVVTYQEALRRMDTSRGEDDRDALHRAHWHTVVSGDANVVASAEEVEIRPDSVRCGLSVEGGEVKLQLTTRFAAFRRYFDGAVHESAPKQQGQLGDILQAAADGALTATLDYITHVQHHERRATSEGFPRVSRSLRRALPVTGTRQLGASVAMMTPANFHTSHVTDVVQRDVCCYHSSGAPEGLKRGLMAVGGTEGVPQVRCLCTGQVAVRGRSMSAAQRQYALELGRTGYILRAHPLYNAWALANEPPKGRTGNCIFQMMDVIIPRSWIDDDHETDAGEPKGGRRAKLEALKKITEDSEQDLQVVVAVLVQVSGGDGEILEVHYGDEYDRSYEAGSPPEAPAFVGQQELFAMMEQKGMSRKDMALSLLLSGAPLNRITHDFAAHVRGLSPRIPAVTGNPAALQGPATVPSRVIEWVGGAGAEQGSEQQPPASEVPAGSSLSNPIDLEDEAPGESRESAILVGNVAPPLQVAREDKVQFVGVVVHDGSRVVYTEASSKCPMGCVSDRLVVPMGKSTELFWGLYAAQRALRVRLGAVWEHQELGADWRNLKLLGATRRGKAGDTVTAWYECRLESLENSKTLELLQQSFEGRQPTPTEKALYVGLKVCRPDEFSSSEPDARTVKSIVAGTAKLEPVKEVRLEVPKRLHSHELQRKDPAYLPGVDVSGKPRAFYDLDRTVGNLQADDYRPPRREQATPITGARSTRDGVMKALAEESTRALDFDFCYHGGDDEEAEQGESGDAWSQDVEDSALGREAHFRPSSFHPHSDNPEVFLNRLRPSGLPKDVSRRLREAQAVDTYCKDVKAQIRRCDELKRSSTVRAELNVKEGGIVSLDLTAIPTLSSSKRKRSQKRAEEKLAKEVAPFRVGGDGTLYHVGKDQKGDQVLEYVVPKEEQDVLLEAAHDGMAHLGEDRTLQALRASRMWWPSMAVDVKNFIKQCPTCAFNKIGPYHGAMHIPPNGYKPWQVVCVDIVDLEDTSAGNRKAIVFADRFGRGVRAFAVPDTVDSKAFLSTMIFHLIPEVGVPQILISDRGSNLISKLCQEFYKAFGIEHVAADSHMHTAVALTERFNASLRTMARAAYFDTKCEWDLFLPYLVLFYNATVQRSTGYSPFFIEHGWEPVLPWHPDVVPKEASLTASEFVYKHTLGLHLAWEAVMAKLDEAERRRKEAHDQKYQTNLSFSSGDPVLVLQPGRRSKMELPYVGPFRVVTGPDERDRYVLQDLHGRQFPEFHVSKLKLYPESGRLDPEYYHVERFEGVRMHEGVQQWLVKWRGYSTHYNSWEPWEHLNEGAREDAIQYAQEQNEQDTDERRSQTGATADTATTGGGDATTTAEGVSNKAKGKKKKPKKVPAAQPEPTDDTTNKQSNDREQRAAERAARFEAQGHY